MMLPNDRAATPVPGDSAKRSVRPKQGSPAAGFFGLGQFIVSMRLPTEAE
jgi:hypothetical protein